jgi:hypothetical protein
LTVQYGLKPLKYFLFGAALCRRHIHQCSSADARRPLKPFCRDGEIGLKHSPLKDRTSRQAVTRPGIEGKALMGRDSASAGDVSNIEVNRVSGRSSSFKHLFAAVALGMGGIATVGCRLSRLGCDPNARSERTKYQGSSSSVSARCNRNARKTREGVYATITPSRNASQAPMTRSIRLGLL